MMKKLLSIFLVLTTLVAVGQNKNGNFRKIQKPVDELMYLTSNILDGVMMYEKAKKMDGKVRELNSEYTRMGRYLDRLTEPDEARLVEVVSANMATLMELTNDELKDWYSEDVRSNYGHQYVQRTGELFSEVVREMNVYAELFEVRSRPMEALERFETQQELVNYTYELKMGASAVDSLVGAMKEYVKRSDTENMRLAQKELVVVLSKHIRGYGNEQFFNGQTALWDAYQKYYMALLDLASADLLADITRMNYDLVEYRSISNATSRSVEKTLSFFDNEKKLLESRESKFVRKLLPKAPKRK